MDVQSILQGLFQFLMYAGGLVAKYPVVGLGIVGVVCILMFLLSSMIELSMKRWFTYFVLLLLIIFIIVVFFAMGIHIQVPLDEALLNISEEFLPK